MRFDRELVLKPAISSKKSWGGCRRTTRRALSVYQETARDRGHGRRFMLFLEAFFAGARGHSRERPPRFFLRSRLSLRAVLVSAI